jgi:hypothetical protein
MSVTRRYHLRDMRSDTVVNFLSTCPYRHVDSSTVFRDHAHDCWSMLSIFSPSQTIKSGEAKWKRSRAHCNVRGE